MYYYIAFVDRYLNVYKKHEKVETIKSSSIPIWAERLFLNYIDNLKANALRDFYLNVSSQLEKDNVDLDTMHQALCDIRDKTISEFEKREKGQL
jgi:thymidylate synthase